MAQANLETNFFFDNTVSSLDSKSPGAILQRTLKGLEIPDVDYFKGENHFEENDTQNYLVFQPLNKYLTSIGSTKYI